MTRILLRVHRSRTCPLRARWGGEQRDQTVSHGYPLAAFTWTSAGRLPSQTIFARKGSRRSATGVGLWVRYERITHPRFPL